MDIKKEDLLEMMNEYWAIDNNEVCRKKTIEFMKKYKIYPQEIHCTEITNKEFSKD